MTNRSESFLGSDEAPLTERVVRISRVAKVVKGGRHLSFNAVVVVGDYDGHVGVGLGKADAVPDAVRKGATAARRNIITVPLIEGTIPHETIAKFGGSQVMLKPASPGTGVIAGGAVRAVVELVGIKDILTKARRSTNPVNVTKATVNGLASMRNPKEELERRRQLVEKVQANQQEVQRRVAMAAESRESTDG